MKLFILGSSPRSRTALIILLNKLEASVHSGKKNSKITIMKSLLLPFIGLLLMLSLTSSRCNKEVTGVEQLIIENHSGHEMFFWFSYRFPNHHFPDTTLPAIIPTEDTPYSEIIGTGPGNGGGVGAGVGVSPVAWSDVFSQLPDGYFSVYFFETRPETQAEWDILRADMTKVHRKDVTHEELKVNNFIIRYP